jgi:antagonist of KipI
VGTIQVLHPGLFTTVQDLGREGRGSLGVSASGASDPLSLRVGNRLVGNEDGAAALEMTLRGATLRFEEDALVALAGAPMPGLPAWTATRVRAGETLSFGVAPWGARAFLCVAGGIAVPPVLGSRSTHVASGLGGMKGRAVHAGDRIPLGVPRGPARESGLASVAQERLEAALRRPALRAVAGPREASEALWASAYSVTDRSDRMGIRLRGPAALPPEPAGRVTEGTVPGAVQVPPDGQPILLLADRPPTGGYPVVACVATVDLPCAGQLRPHSSVRFERVTGEAARHALAERERWLDEEVPRVPS